MMAQCLSIHYQQPVAFSGNVAEGEGNVGEHDEVADEDGGDIILALPHQLVLDASLGIEGNVHVDSPLLVHRHLFHEVEESAMDVSSYDVQFFKRGEYQSTSPSEFS